MNEPTTWHLAQLNVARALEPLDVAARGLLADFYAQLDAINRLAEAASGFVWRLVGDGGNATDIRVGGDAYLLVNMSVWTSRESLFDFVYRTAHAKVMARRREWFEKPIVAHQVLFWIPAGHVPTLDEAMARLELLRVKGPSPDAFTFKTSFGPPDAPVGPRDMKPEPYCTA
jgi:hypothetical protein